MPSVRSSRAPAWTAEAGKSMNQPMDKWAFVFIDFVSDYQTYSNVTWGARWNLIPEVSQSKTCMQMITSPGPLGYMSWPMPYFICDRQPCLRGINSWLKIGPGRFQDLCLGLHFLEDSILHGLAPEHDALRDYLNVYKLPGINMTGCETYSSDL